MNDSRTYNWHTNLNHPKYSAGGPLNNFSSEGGHPYYYADGFLPIQDRISRAYLNMRCEEVECRAGNDTPQIRAQRFPYPAYVHDPINQGLEILVAAFIMLAFVFTVYTAVKFIGLERQRKIKELMTNMGMSTWLHWTCWFLIMFLYMLLMMAIISFCLQVSQSFHKI